MQPLISPDKPLHFDSLDRFGHFVPPQMTFEAESRELPRAQTWFQWLCAHGDIAAKLGFVASMGYLALAIAYGSTLNGTFEHTLSRAASMLDETARQNGLAIGQITIAGRVQLRESEVLAALGDTASQSILSFDATAAKARLAEIGWIKSVDIQRQWPSSLDIQITERTAAAVWRRSDRLIAVDTDGRELGPLKAEEMEGLIRIEGEGAPDALKPLLTVLAGEPQLRGGVVQATRIGQRRWNLTLRSGVIVKLNDMTMPVAMRTLAQFTTTHPELMADLTAIDLRAPAQTALMLKAPGKESRQKLIAAVSETAPSSQLETP